MECRDCRNEGNKSYRNAQKERNRKHIIQRTKIPKRKNDWTNDHVIFE